MKIGTKSVLFGVHQFLWHPWTVGLAWRQIYDRWPRWWEWVAIAVHDLGYWGCPDIDGELGQAHPVKGAKLAEWLTRWIAATLLTLRHPIRMALDDGFKMQAWMLISDTAQSAHDLAIGHSRFYAKKSGFPLSDLFRADKLCVRFEPTWFYIARATASGEIWEFIEKSPTAIWDGFDSGGAFDLKRYWFSWYRLKVEQFA